MSVNKVILIGNVGQDPRVKYFDTGSAVATFPLATTDRGYTLANGTQIPVIVMSVNGDKVTEDGRILTDRGQRIRDVRTGPDGYLYVLTDESSGELLKVSPRN